MTVSVSLTRSAETVCPISYSRQGIWANLQTWFLLRRFLSCGDTGYTLEFLQIVARLSTASESERGVGVDAEVGGRWGDTVS